MFGDQAVRLLREGWGGVIEPDVNGNLVERGATSLAEELYAMFSDDIPQTQNAPLTLNKKDPNAGAPLTINNDFGGSSLDVNGGDTTFNGGNFTVATPQGTATIVAGTTAIPGDKVSIGATGANGAPGFGVNTGSSSPEDPAKKKPIEPFHLDLPPLEDITVGGVNLADLLDDAGGSSVTLGKVVSGSGATYKVALYASGPAQPSTATVTATVPQIAKGEVVPPGTWIAAVVRASVRTTSGVSAVIGTTYSFQPPVWL